MQTARSRGSNKHLEVVIAQSAAVPTASTTSLKSEMRKAVTLENLADARNGVGGREVALTRLRYLGVNSQSNARPPPHGTACIHGPMCPCVHQFRTRNWQPATGSGVPGSETNIFAGGLAALHRNTRPLALNSRPQVVAISIDPRPYQPEWLAIDGPVGAGDGTITVPSGQVVQKRPE